MHLTERPKMFMPIGHNVMKLPGSGETRKYRSEQRLNQVAMILRGCSWGLLMDMTSVISDTGSTMEPRPAMLLADMVAERENGRCEMKEEKKMLGRGDGEAVKPGDILASASGPRVFGSTVSVTSASGNAVSGTTLVPLVILSLLLVPLVILSFLLVPLVRRSLVLVPLVILSRVNSRVLDQICHQFHVLPASRGYSESVVPEKRYIATNSLCSGSHKYLLVVCQG